MGQSKSAFLDLFQVKNDILIHNVLYLNKIQIYKNNLFTVTKIC